VGGPVPPGRSLGPDWPIIRELFRFGLPTGIQGVAMNVGGVLLLAFIGSLPQERRGPGRLHHHLHPALLPHHLDRRRPHGRRRHRRRPEPGRRPARRSADAVDVRPHGSRLARRVGLLFLLAPRQLLAVFGMAEPRWWSSGVQLLRYLSVSGLFIAVALTYTGGLQGTGDTQEPPLHLHHLPGPRAPRHVLRHPDLRDPPAGDIWLAIVVGHITRAGLSVARFRQGRWRSIAVDIGPVRS
jgi:Na+-driven multidrug efflux pump